ncbi:Splicing factor 3B subunit 6 [Coemansia sp. RSA 1813]|nr:Splicing factor 3B subunit 6 [Coemansia sp. RSA 1646]KAJ1769956.1 Splicing factor 3B subunit 6 [Coemansia sp. RSA 1843]KAJ2087867.1 Splicing factor 3B subunit 6 [Coemansia sp. RSA 986]KAJ2212759.1 Splicing factor 3B subunit 6 [Coemansia sp. RSA 487]KAJ2567498.1 Splicing factor 3B subunit 6 [Coemansia sp. RSA 1813]
MSLAQKKNRTAQLPPNVNRILLVKNLSFKITSEEMYDLFGKYGAIRQIRMGSEPKTRGTAFVVYEDIYDAKEACDHLQGFNVMGRYLVVLYFQTNHKSKRTDLSKEEERVENLRKQYNSMNRDEEYDMN